MNFPTALVIIAALVVGYFTYTAWLDHQLRLRRLELRPRAGEDFTQSNVVNNTHYSGSAEPIDWSIPVRPAGLKTENIKLELSEEIVQVDTEGRSMDDLPNVDHIHDLRDVCVRNRLGSRCVSVPE